MKNKFNWRIFLISFFALAITSFVSIIFVAGREEGTVEVIFLSDIMEVLFYIVRFPVLNFIFSVDYVNSYTVIGGYFLNCLLYSFLIERLYVMVKKK